MTSSPQSIPPTHAASEPTEAGGATSRAEADLLRVVEQRTFERDRAWKHSLDLQLIIGPDGFIGAANEAWETLLGWPPHEVIGRHFSHFTHPDDRDATEDAVRTARLGELRRFEKRCLHKTDGFRWISWVAAPEDKSIYASGRDVTLERENAAALATLERQLRQGQKMEALGQLTGGLAHDFNNYLGVVSNSFAALRQALLDDATAPAYDRRFAEAAIERGERAARQAGALTQRLLCFAREEPLRAESTDLGKLLNESADLMRGSLPASIALDITTSETLGMPPCFALVDANRFDNALLNLCINARDAMPEGGRIRLSASEVALDAAAATALDLPPGRHACVEVADTGTGLSDEVRLRMFDPFFNTKAAGQGTGLGLSMVYGFARQSGGQVTAETSTRGGDAGTGSGTGTGTVVRLYLPLA